MHIYIYIYTFVLSLFAPDPGFLRLMTVAMLTGSALTTIFALVLQARQGTWQKNMGRFTRNTGIFMDIPGIYWDVLRHLYIYLFIYHQQQFLMFDSMIFGCVWLIKYGLSSSINFWIGHTTGIFTQINFHKYIYIYIYFFHELLFLFISIHVIFIIFNSYI